jgi:hypothetical protein
MRRSVVLVTRVPPFGDDSLPAFTAGALPWLFIEKAGNSLQGFLQGQTLQQRMTLVERQLGYIAAIKPQQVENVIVGAILAPVNFAVEDDLSHGQTLQRLRNRGAILRETIAGRQSYIIPMAEGYEPDSIKLAFKDPLRSGKAFLGEGRPHRLDPFGEGHERNYDGFKSFKIAAFCRRYGHCTGDIWRIRTARTGRTV